MERAVRGRPSPKSPIKGFDDVAILMFTSGTTGQPKGVVLTYGNVWWNSVNVDSRIDTRRGDVTHAAAPLFHIGALNSFGCARWCAAARYRRRAFDPAEFLATWSSYKSTRSSRCPPCSRRCRQVPDSSTPTFASARVVVAGAPVPPSLIRQYAGHGVRSSRRGG